jgi:hypothetical protein
MAYAKDIKLIRINNLDPNDNAIKYVHMDPLWFGKEEDMLPVENNNPDTDYVDLVTPEEAIKRYENFMKSNPQMKANLKKQNFIDFNDFEALLYDRRTVAVAYLNSPWGTYG